ncbi:hypothetical protein J4G33_00200 [Actinotalea sp. BY-33]|uniref:Uncharacterized protein n=2 Tax=Actinotalea soli TaxID=2819234 RepID=A0A939RU43_9CELL|nr:hypothetical protein [Actinotalea soli]
MSLPRAVLLALWLQGTGPGEPSPQTLGVALRAIQDEDEPHTVAGAEDLVPDGAPLADLLRRWAGADQVAALLPVPGDVSGAPAAVADLAVDAGECLLVHHEGRSWAAVPEVEGFGSELEPGFLVTWRLHEVEDWRARLPGVVGTLPEAEQALRHALREATEALAGLDVARWRPDAAEAIVALRGDDDPGWLLPTGLSPRAVRVLAQAWRLRAIVALATADDGGAVNLWQADQRSAALRHVDHAARRAAAAATLGRPRLGQPEDQPRTVR